MGTGLAVTSLMECQCHGSAEGLLGKCEMPVVLGAHQISIRKASGQRLIFMGS